MSGGAPRLALVGCGAISEAYHLPGLAHFPGVLARTILVDPDPARREALAATYAVGGEAADAGEILDRVDGAIIAVPHHLHAPLVTAFLERGLPVLCEKPLAAAHDEARELARLSERLGVPLAVNQTRRLFPAYARIRALLADGALGTLRALHYSDGKLFRWPTKSGFYFRQTGGAGVLLDKGVHGMDTICWWLDGTPELVASRNDAMGGREAVAHVDARHDACEIRVRFSWLARLPNCYTIVGDEGTISGGIEEWSHFTWQRRGERPRRVTFPREATEYRDFARPMIANFLEVVAGRADPLVPAAGVLPALDWIDGCYREARPFDMPWMPERAREVAPHG